jgi:hypothetical protein
VSVFDLPTVSGGDGEFVVSAHGDFNAADETFQVILDGLDFGYLFDNDPDNDRFENDSNSTGDVGTKYGSETLTARAVVGQEELDAILEDGIIEFLVNFGQQHEVGDLGDGEFIQVSLIFPTLEELPDVVTPSTVAVPLPTTLALFGAGLFGLGLTRRR